MRAVDTFGYEVEVAQTGINTFTIEEVKPYLRPMGSMTEEEKYYIKEHFFIEVWDKNDKRFWIVRQNQMNDYISWLNEHHFDHCNLISKGLALEAPKDMYKIN